MTSSVNHVLIFVACLSATSNGKCPETVDNNTLSFTKKLSSNAYVRTGEEKSIECCAQGFDHILWSFRATNSSSWNLFPFWLNPCSWCEDRVILSDRNQTLRILKSEKLDDGIYRCIPSNLTNDLSIHHNTSLEVYDCTDRGKPLPLPPHDVLTQPHGNATFVCGGDFGCKDTGLMSVDWLIGDDYVDELNHSRYTIIKEYRDAKTVLKTIFTISNVQTSDFALNYTCRVISDYVGGNSVFVVHLRNIDTRNIVQVSLRNVLLIAIGGSLFLIIISATVAITHKLYGPQINFYYKSRISCSSLIDKGNKRFHVFVCHSEDDQEALNTISLIIDELTFRGYSVASTREDEILGGQNRLYAAMDLLEQSASVLYIESRITEEYERIAENVNATISPRYISLVLITNKRNNSFYKHKAFQNLVTIQWPGKKSNSRLQNKFFCSLQLRLPRLKVKTVPKDGNKYSDQETGRLLSTSDSGSAA